nr:hypothetical protein [Tanacetum cinerariifolium]
MAFISLANTSSGKGEVHTASVPTASTQVSTASADVAAASISHDTIDEDDIKEMDIKWNMALLSMRADRFWKKTGKKITIQGTDVAGFDKSKVECFNCHKMGYFDRECRAPRSQDRGRRESYKQGNHALVADDEALTEFKNTDSLNTKISKLNEELSDSKNTLYHYKLGLSQVEARLVEFKTQEIKFCEKIRGLELDVEFKNNKIENLMNELEQVKKEKEGLDSKLTGFESALKDLDTLLGSQRTGLPEFADDTITDYSRPSPSIESNISDLQNTNSPTVIKTNKVKTARKSSVKYAEMYRNTLKSPKVRASTDESMLWHRRLGHLNFKTMNKLVRHNLVKGLPSKCYENDHTCVACLKGKQHKASCKTKLVNSVSKPLHTLHMDLFGPTSVSSLNHKWYCLVVTDDLSRFTWTFFLRTKIETSGILRNFISEIENLKDLKVRIIRCDNGGEFKNKEINEFCTRKGIKREFSNARTPQQNRVAKRRNKTLIKAARTMLADAKLPVTFWAEAVNTACYVQNRVLTTWGSLMLKGMKVILLENKLNEKGAGPNWLFDIDTLTNSMNYVSVVVAGTSSTNISAHLESSNSDAQDACNADVTESSGNSNPSATSKNPLTDQMETLIVESEILTVSSPVPTACLDKFEDILGDTTNIVNTNGVESDLSNMESIIPASPTPTFRIHKDHLKSQIIGLVDTPVQTRHKSKEMKEHGFIATIHQKKNPDLLQFCLFLCFLSPKEPKKIFDALKDPRVRPIGTKWVLKNKKDKRGIVIRNKARLVAQGYTQEEGIDYEEVFAPVARIEAIRLFLAYASFMGFIVYQMDVKGAFLYGTIDEEVYVMQPLVFLDPEFPDRVYKVEKAMYGLHQAPRAWYGTLSKYLLANGFQRDVRSANTPMDKENPWGKDRPGKYMELHFYRSIIGSLMYLTASRPDIMFAVCACARHQVTPKECHLYAVKRIFRYLKGHPKLGLWYPKESLFDLVAYSDSDYSGATQDRKSTTGGCQFLGRRMISWQCKKQTIVGTSTIKEKYISASSGCGQVLWIQNQFLDYGLRLIPLFWSTARIETTNEGTKILAIVDDEPVSHLRDDNQREAFPTVTSLDAGQDRENIIKTSALPHESTPRVTSEGRSLEIGEEVRVERSSDLGSNDTEEMVNVLTSMEAANILTSPVAAVSVPPVAGISTVGVPTVSGLVPTVGAIFTTASVVTPYSRRPRGILEKDKVAREIKEEITREDQRMNEQHARDAKIARIHAEEELKMLIDGLDRSNEVQQSKPLSKKEQRELYMSVLRSHNGWKTKHFRGMTLEEIREKFIPVWKQIEDFVPMSSTKEAQRVKRKGLKLDEGSAKRMKTSKDEEDLKGMMQLVPVEEVYVEALQVKHPIIDWEIHSEGKKDYWKIIRLGRHTAVYQFFMDMIKQFNREDLQQLWNLVKETLSIRHASSDKDKELWVELERMFEPDFEDQL